MAPFPWTAYRGSLRVFAVGSATKSSGLKLRLKQITLLGVLSLMLPYVVAQPAAAAALVLPTPSASANTVFLDVRTGVNSLTPHGPKQNQPITNYKWLLNLDNTGDPAAAQSDLYCHPSSNITLTGVAPAGGTLNTTYVRTQAGYPQGCEWPSIRTAVASPVLSEGTQADWNTTKALPAGGTYGDPTVTGLPNNCPTYVEPTKPCRYLLSVTADGYQIGGVHFSVPSPTSTISVYLNPFPLPLGTVRVKVFQDSSPTDGTYDQSTELGLEGFHGILNDTNGIIQADYFGNPLCTVYLTYQNTNRRSPGYTTNAALVGKIVLDSFGKPTPVPAQNPAPRDRNGYYNPTVPGDCLSDTNGDIVIPNMAPNHYSASVTPPIGAKDNWVQTTTLEGNHDFDVWLMPNDTGLDTELVVGGEPVPNVEFGFVPATPAPSTWTCNGTSGTTSGCGRITGQLYGSSVYQPGLMGLPQSATNGGQAGLKLQDPVDRGWVTLNNLNASTGDFDTAVATIPTQDPTRVGLHYPDCPAAPTPANPTHAGWGCFEFANVPDGEYMLTIWDEPQETILDSFNATISHGQIINLGVLPLTGWFSHIFGKVCIDTNFNGRCDPGEKGVFHQTVQNLNRTNNAMVGGINTSDTDNNGNYDFKEAYPLGLMTIDQYFNTRFKTTGVTWQACNDPQEHTIIAPMVDVSYLPQLGQCGRLDWAVTPYFPSATGDNGGVVATMIYDEVRQKYNARQAQTNDYQTGIPGFTFEQYTPIKGSGPGGTDSLSGYALSPTGAFCTAQGTSVGTVTLANGQTTSCGDATNPLLSYISENNAPPAQCFPQDANGKPIGYVPGNSSSLDFMVSGGACIESAAAATQFGLGTDNGALHPVQTVDGNYTLGNIPNIVPAAQLGDVLVKADSPVDTVLPAVNGVPRPLYRFTTEEDVNMFTGPQYVPQGSDMSSLPWLPSQPVNQMPNDLSKPAGGYEENPYTYAPGPDPICAGPTHTVQANKISGIGTVGATTLTDSTKSWGVNQLAGRTVTRGASTLFVISNTATVLTGGGGWSPAAPASGTYSISINPDLMANGGSPLEGTVRSLCDTKLLNVQAGQSIAPNFHAITTVDIPLPAHFWGYIVNDLSVSSDPKSYNIGGVQGIPGVPVGVYDWSGRRVYSANSDYNGAWEVLMPSSDIFNCLTPAGMCPNVYRFVGNDPGQPAHPNLNYDSNYRTIAADFEAWPNMLSPADTAPTRVTSGLLGPGVQFNSTAPCGIKVAEPQLYAIGPDPFIKAASGTLTITGANFGPTQGAGAVRYTPDSGATPISLNVNSWSDQSISVAVGRSVMPVGSGMISVTNATGLGTTNGVAFHVLSTSNTGTGYLPNIVTVGPGKMFDPFAVNAAGVLTHPFAIQDALDYAAAHWRTLNKGNANTPANRWLVVVYPKWDVTGVNNQAFVPQGTYFENVIVHSPLELQGVGPGGINADGTVVQGSIIDGRFWNTVAQGQFDQGAAGTIASQPSEPTILHWLNLLASLQTTGTGFTGVTGGLPWNGSQDPGEGAVVTVLGTTGTYPSNYRTGVDGFTISGGDQNGFPGNISNITGLSGNAQAEGAVEAGALSEQGGAVFMNGGTDNYKLTDDLIKQDSGSYGAVRLGTEYQIMPNQTLAGGPSHNYNASISHDVLTADGGTNLAGAIGLFDDSNGYSIDHSLLCMNVSAEYGGAISHFGYSPNGKISSNRIFLNTAYDEGGAITIASEPAFTVSAGTVVPSATGVTNGTGAVSIDHNYISDNMAQDDGGAMRIMGTAGSKSLSPISINDNVISNNVSAHEGGAISLSDDPVVNIVNNTIAQNVTTATATTSDGLPAPAGIAVDINSAGLNVLLATTYKTQVPSWMGTSTWPRFSNAQILNDILWYNRAGSWSGSSGVAQIGMPGDTSTMNFWDVGSTDASALLTVRSSQIGSSPSAPTQQYINGGGNVVSAPPATGGLCSNVPTDANSCAAAAYNAPKLVNPYATSLSVVQMRTYFRFRPAAIITVDLPPDLFNIASYRIALGSPAQKIGFNPTSTTMNPSPVPTDDIENFHRPAPTALVDAGAYQVTGR